MFGMGTGVTLSVRSPETCEEDRFDRHRHLMRSVDNSILMGKFEREKLSDDDFVMIKPHDRLVQVS